MTRGVAFAGLVASCAVLAGGYVGWKALLDKPGSTAASPGSALDLDAGGRILFQNVIRDDGYAKLSSVSIDRPAGRRTVSGVVCERVHYAAGRGLCLLPRSNVLGHSYIAILLDAKLRTKHEISLPGINNRARVSPDGRYAAATGFVVGDSYLDAGFSTRTFIVDASRGKVLANVEDFTVYRAGNRIRSIDFNFWGVTFARNSNRFYATLSTRGKTYLVRGDVAKKRFDVVWNGVECPSLSPDDSRIVFKKRVGKSGWRLSVLDLKTLVETPLAETHSVDDQAEWLDGDEVVYGLNGDVWALRADGGGKPRKLIPDALSPAVIRS